MFVKIAVAAVALPLALGTTAVVSSDWAVIKVKNSRDGVNITVPVPLTAVQAALAFAPRHAQHVKVDAADHDLATARQALAALRGAEDRILVRVDDGDEQVLIRKVQDTLEVNVDGRRGEKVKVRLPLEAASQALAAVHDGHFDSSALIDALRAASGEIVHVVDAENDISIRIF